MKCNVYDFDKTIYAKNSETQFIFYLFRHQPKTLLNVFNVIAAFLGYTFKIISKQRMKERFWHCLNYVKDVDKALDDFWDKEKANIFPYYLKNHQPDDVVVSASTEFILRPIMKILNIKYCYASKVDKHTGRYQSNNCYGEEKVVRLLAEMPEVEIEEFYSDSHSDDPLAKMSKKAYIVKKGELEPWN